MKILEVALFSFLLLSSNVFSAETQITAASCVLPSAGIYERSSTGMVNPTPLYYKLINNGSGAVTIQMVTLQTDGTFDSTLINIPGVMSDPQVHDNKCVVSITEGQYGGNLLEDMSHQDSNGSFSTSLSGSEGTPLFTESWKRIN
jgi:hypothetical protein